MKSSFFPLHLSFSLLLLFIAGSACTQSADLTVVIIRHGEKNEATGNLSCQGLHRALQLPPVLTKKFPKIAYIYVPSLSDGKSTGHARMFQTITPFAVQNNLAVNSKYGETDHAGVAADVLKKSGVVLLVWEHGNIPAIASALGVKNPPSWNGSDFDSIWIITYADNKKGHLKATLSIDSEGLKPPQSCNF